MVKGVNFVDLIDAGDPVAQARLYDEQGADELCFLDITATYEDRGVLYHMVTAVAEQCFMPLTVGGGVRTLEDIRQLLLAGADKVSINSAAVKRPEFVREAAEKFGAQCIVVAMDVKRAGSREQGAGSTERDMLSAPRSLLSTFQIFTHGGRNATGIEALGWAERMVAYGAGELLVTSMDADGTKHGYDIELTRAIADSVSVPVIASGGVGALKDFAAGAKEGHATGLLAASVFHFGQFSVQDVKRFMAAEGIPVRV